MAERRSTWARLLPRRMPLGPTTRQHTTSSTVGGFRLVAAFLAPTDLSHLRSHGPTPSAPRGLQLGKRQKPNFPGEVPGPPAPAALTRLQAAFGSRPAPGLQDDEGGSSGDGSDGSDGHSEACKGLSESASSRAASKRRRNA